jgi:hypothetical protein
MSIENSNIPNQHQGRETNVVSEIELATVAEAQKVFETAKTKLLNISHWGETADGPSSKFKLTDPHGNDVDRMAQTGDHFKIKIPAPGSGSGDGFDWVRIESIQSLADDANDVVLTSIRVRPASNPNNEDKAIAHFFDPEATSTFVVKRDKTKVSAEVHGRNETPNLHAEGFFDGVRHVLVAMGAMVGFSDPQWKNLTDGLIDKKAHEEK